MNQYGKRDYQKLTYSMDPRNADALSASKSIESLIRNTIAQLQKEGSPVLRSQRYVQGGARATDYYVPSGFAQQVKLAVEEEISRIESQRGRSSGLSLSSASPATFRTQSANIMDSRVKAEIASLVKQHGGFFSQDPGGSAQWGVDASLSIPGAGGRNRNLASSLSARVNSSNASWRRKWENLMLQATGQSHDYNNYSPGDIASMGKDARRTIGRRTAQAAAITNEKQATYDRLARRGRLAGHTQQYGIDNPNDPVVKARAMAAKKASGMKRGRKLRGAGRFAIAAITTTLATLVGAAITSVALLARIRDAVVDLGGEVKRRAMSDMRYNFGDTTMQGWERFAAKKGFDKGLLPSVAGSLTAHWSNPLFYTGAAFSKLGPLLRDKVAGMTAMATAGGDENVWGLFNTLIGTVADASFAGRTSTKSGVSPNQAAMENLEALRQAEGDDVANMASLYIYEKMRSGMSMTPSEFFRQGETNPEYMDTSARMTGPAQRDALEKARERAAGLGSSVSSAVEALLTGILANTGQMIEYLRAFVAKALGWALPSFALKEKQRNIDMNIRAEQLALANLPSEESAVEKEMRRYGLGGAAGAQSAFDLIKKGDFGRLGVSAVAMSKMKNDTKLVYAMAKYLGTKDALALIEEQRDKDMPAGVVYTAEESANSAAINATAAMWGARRAGVASMRRSSGDLLLPDLVGYASGNMSAASLAKLIAKSEKGFGSNFKAMGVDKNYTSFENAEDFLLQQIYAYALTPGRDKDASTSFGALESFYKNSGGPYGMGGTRKMSNKLAEVKSKMEELRQAGLLGTSSLETEASVQEDLVKMSYAAMLQTKLNDAIGKGGKYRDIADALENGIGTQRAIVADVANPDAWKEGAETTVRFFMEYNVNGKKVSSPPFLVTTSRGFKEDARITAPENFVNDVFNALQDQR